MQRKKVKRLIKNYFICYITYFENYYLFRLFLNKITKKKDFKT